MNQPWTIDIVFEDALSKAVIQKIFFLLKPPIQIGHSHSRGGNDYIRRNLKSFNLAAKGSPFFVLTDLDRAPCPPSLIQSWLGMPRHPNLLFRIAVCEVESWVLADRKAFSAFLGVPINRLPINPDQLIKPKAALIDLVKKSKKKRLIEDIVPKPGSTAKIGRNYNGRLTAFVLERWDAHQAARNSESLCRTMRRLAQFRPV